MSEIEMLAGAKKSIATSAGTVETAIHRLFEEQAAAAPDRVCVLCEKRALTYGELNALANRLAYRLKSRGVARGTLVGVGMQSCPELFVALLAISKAGGAYVPLDPQFPDQRLEYMLRDTSCPVVVVHGQTVERLRPVLSRTAVLGLHVDELCGVDEPTTNLDVEVGPNDLACVMYTSGSTGQPKGVLVGHRAVVRLVRATDYCRFGPEEVFLQLAPLAFDASTFEIWGPLLNGGRLALMPPGPPVPEAVGTAIRRYGVTTLWLTAGLFHLMVDQCVEELRPIRQLLAGGDVLSPRHVQKALAALEDGVVINGYGPTENTTFTCCFRMTRDYQVTGPIPIGQPIAHTSIVILDEAMNPVPLGESGELYAAGAGVAFGYLNNPELTRQHFLPNPFGEPGSRMYRTGDRVRLRPDGNVEFLGRFDNQVKLRGHRVEPAEVEACILRHPDVRQAVVVPYTQSTGDKHLVAYIVASDPSHFSAAAIRRYLADHLPQPLIPALFLPLERLPLNPNGKIDRTALPAPEIPRTAASRPLRLTETEAQVVVLWSRILNCDVGLDDNFFELGGNSLQLIQLHSELAGITGRQPPVTVLFEKTTVRALAGWMDGDTPCDSGLRQARDRAERQRRAFCQHRIRGIVR